ncbi:MAG: exopolysaccharide biosynthesis polyprenyl glycosylphosphotransferase [Bacteroidales bacterium]|nr:exopolysaccharide biosynthesis polyprenyl glycosylphosphotransferase [Bacteroidales bacterium]
MTHLYSKLRDYRINNKGRAKFVIDLFELVLAALAFPIALFITQKYIVPDMVIRNGQVSILFIFIMMSWFVLSRVTAMAKVPRTQRYRTLAFQLSRVAFVTFVGLTVVKVLLRLTSIPIELIVVYVTVMFFLNGSFRILAYKALKTYRSQGHSVHNVLVLADAFSDNIIERLIEQKEWGFRIHGIMTNSRLLKAKYGDTINIYPETDNLKSILDNEVIDEVLHCKKDVNRSVARAIADICNETGVIFRLQSTVSPIDPVDFQLQTVAHEEELALIDAPSNSMSLILKNMGDMYFSLMAVILLAPLFLLLAIVIRIDSRGPVFFKQERIGLRGRKFKLYKFRTMVVNAEELLARLQDKNEADGPVFKIAHDPRITRVGRFLRKTGLDELPQLFNVLKGEMSLVGPRPPLEKEVKKYKRWQLKRLSVKPGITCSWQVVPDRHNVSFEEWMRLDLGYIKNWSLYRDMGLFVKTLRTFISAGGH